MSNPALDYNPYKLTETELQQRLCSLFSGNEWDSHIKLPWGMKLDYNSYVTGNILLILNACGDITSELQTEIAAARRGLERYQDGHLTYFFPLQKGKSFPPSAGIIQRVHNPNLSPDADCCAIQQLVLKQKNLIPKMIAELEYHRIGINNYRLCSAQKKLLSQAEGSFTAFFPRHRGFCLNSYETVDLGSDLHVIWLLNQYSDRPSRGYDETVDFIHRAILSDLIEKDPLIVSPYYANSALLCYIASRAIVWGEIAALMDLRAPLLELAKRLRPVNIAELTDILCAALLWDDRDLILKCLRLQDSLPRELSPYCLAPFLITVPHLERLARLKCFQAGFFSEALLLAKLLWVKSALSVN